ncbi:MAG: 50S ribosomal protein L9 [Calditrichaeota bacterium]|nr:50S ribosomal protein L9 [Candidatus Cloacimonadota bacterium]MCA9786989.1 50S ribosomal protein L9 [Candidatus Cloacimonadota bacterium]MCB1047056.1 50S ribosomal protein L9 [Calditrichota bacterium]MCB9475088.1 50S ribosomal protein L9 [Candidatus Delongbacteria bacterium]
MKIILRSEIEHLGKVGDIVSVKPGYARNYLMPQGLAYLADRGSLKRFEDEKRQLLSAAEREMAKAEALKARLEAGSYVAKVKVGNEGRLYGSVTNHQIADLVHEAGFDIERRNIVLERPVKTLGTHDVHVKLYGSMHAVIKLIVMDMEAEVKAAIEAEIAAIEAAEEAERVARQAARQAAANGEDEDGQDEDN